MIALLTLSFAFYICLHLHQRALAKKSSMFDDPIMEIQELIALIKDDITALNIAAALKVIPMEGKRNQGKLDRYFLAHLSKLTQTHGFLSSKRYSRSIIFELIRVSQSLIT